MKFMVAQCLWGKLLCEQEQIVKVQSSCLGVSPHSKPNIWDSNLPFWNVSMHYKANGDSRGICNRAACNRQWHVKLSLVDFHTSPVQALGLAISLARRLRGQGIFSVSSMLTFALPPAFKNELEGQRCCENEYIFCLFGHVLDVCGVATEVK